MDARVLATPGLNRGGRRSFKRSRQARRL